MGTIANSTINFNQAYPTSSHELPHQGAVSSDSSPLYSLFERTIKNPVFWTITLSGAAAGLITFSAIAFPPLTAGIIAISLIAALAIGIYCNRESIKQLFICEIGLFGNHLKLIVGSERYNWYSKITDDITLGGNPLKNSHYHSLLKEGHKAVLSMVRPSETTPHLLGVPVKPEQWRRTDDVNFLNLPNPDLTPVRDEDVDKGVEFLHAQISKGKRVYVHCNGGISRSATIVAAYLIKHKNKTLKEAIDFIQTRRRVQISETSPALLSFVKRRSEQQLRLIA